MILIACEESQAVTKEFRKLGYEAFSCDILPCSGGHPEWHILGDVTPLLKQKWDLIIAFPPCTHLAASGARWFKNKPAELQRNAIDFFMMFANAVCPRVAIENPVGIMSSVWRKPDVIFHPYHFGDPYRKTTCLWLKGLPQLKYTNIVEPGKSVSYGDKSLPAWYSNLTKKNRAVNRAKTFPGVARAMAEQWGKLLP